MAGPKTLTLNLPDGRHLGYGIYGDASAKRTVFYLHGFPGSHPEALIISDAAARHGLRVVSPSRPGGGGSTFQPGRSITDFTADILALADYLNVDKFVVMAISGGAPYGLAMAHSPRASARMAGLCLVCGLYPTSLGLSGMALSNRALFWLAPWLPTSMLAYLFKSQLPVSSANPASASSAAGEDSAAPGPDALEAALDKQMRTRAPPDVACWTAPGSTLRRAITASVRGAFGDGADGAAWEVRLLARDWGFRLEDVSAAPAAAGNGESAAGPRVVLFHGTEDVNVPVRMAREAAALIGGGKGVEIVVKEGEGHASLGVNCVEEIVGLVRTWTGDREEV